MLRSHRSLLAQLRSGILPLRLETGRLKNIRDENTGHFQKLKAEKRVHVLYVILIVLKIKFILSFYAQNIHKLDHP